MAKRTKVIQETWRKSYELDGELNISTVTITPVYPTSYGDRMLTVSLVCHGRRIRRDDDRYIETAAQVDERRAGMQQTGYAIIGTRQVALRVAS
jgi:hypothetical protein